MTASPFTRTRSDSSFPVPSASRSRESDWPTRLTFNHPSTNSSTSKNPEYATGLRATLSPPLNSFSSLKPNRSFTAGFGSSSPTGELGEVILPFPNQVRNGTPTQEICPKNLSELRSQTSAYPAFRSQSAVYYEHSNLNLQPSNERTQRALAMRRPPAGFNVSKSDQRMVFPSFTTAIRSVPASRCNSDEFAELWNELERINAEEESPLDNPEKNLQKSPVNFQSPLSPNLLQASKSEREYLNSSYLNDEIHISQASEKRPSQNAHLFKLYDNDGFSNMVSHMKPTKISPSNSLQAPRETLRTLKKDLVYPGSPMKGFPTSQQGLRVVRSRSATLATSPFMGLNKAMLEPIGLQNQSVNKITRRRNLTSLPSRTNVPCRYFILGQCSKGNLCHFSHNLPIRDDESAQGHPEGLTSLININFDGSQPTGNSRGNNSKISNKRATEAEKSANLLMDSRFANAEFTDFIGNLYILCQDQPGCRYLQKALERDDQKFTMTIFNEISPHFSKLMTDPFGNYLSQKLMERVGNAYRIELLKIIYHDIAKIALNAHGTRATQKIIEILAFSNEPDSGKAIKILTDSLEPNVVTLIKDSNGNHVIQKCITLFSNRNNQFIFDAISKYCLAVATHKHGCCVIQRCFDNADFRQKDQLAIVIAANALVLVQDPFGNYVVQYVICLENCNYTKGLILNFLGHMPRLSCQKFSSNVIEKCIQAADINLRRQLIGEIAGSKNLESLLQDSYANYVIQTCLDCAEPSQREELIDRIKPILLIAKSSPYIKRIQARILNGQEPHNKEHESALDFSDSRFLSPNNNLMHYGPTQSTQFVHTPLTYSLDIHRTNQIDRQV